MTPRTNIFAYDPVPAACDAARAVGMQIVGSNAEVIKAARIVVLAVKPDLMATVLQDIKEVVGGKLQSKEAGEVSSACYCFFSFSDSSLITPFSNHQSRY